MTQLDARYNLMELMVCVAARQLEDGKTAVIGTGMPLAAATLAQQTTAPNLIIMFEAGSAAPQLTRLPISVADSNTQTRAILHSSMDVIANTGFEMLFVDPLPVTLEPTEQELRVRREQVDPQGIIIGK